MCAKCWSVTFHRPLFDWTPATLEHFGASLSTEWLKIFTHFTFPWSTVLRHKNHSRLVNKCSAVFGIEEADLWSQQPDSGLHSDPHIYSSYCHTLLHLSAILILSSIYFWVFQVLIFQALRWRINYIPTSVSCLLISHPPRQYHPSNMWWRT